MRRLLLIIILLLGISAGSQAADRLSSESAIERCRDIEKTNTDLIKRLKKEYGAGQVTVERWKDGQTYHILWRDNLFARANMAGEIQYFSDRTGRKWPYVHRCIFRHNDNGDRFYLVKLLPTTPWTMTLSDGTVLDTPFNLKETFTLGDMTYCVYMSPDRKRAYDIYRFDGHKINPYPASGYTVYKSGKFITFRDSRAVPCRVRVPENVNFISFRGISQIWDGDSLFAKGNRINLFNGIMNFDKPENGKKSGFCTIERMTLRHYSASGMPVKTDSVILTALTQPAAIYQTNTNRLIDTDVDRVWLIGQTPWVLYRKCFASGCKALGMTDLSGMHADIPPLYDDIYIGENDTIYVRDSYAASYTPYNPDSQPDAPAALPAPQEVIAQALADSTCAAGNRLLGPALVKRLSENISYLDRIGIMIEERAPVMKGRLLCDISIDPDRESLNLNVDSVDYFCLPLLKYVDGSDGTGSPASLYATLNAKTATLDLDYDDYLAMQENKRQEAADRELARKARAEKMRMAREKIARIDAFLGQLHEAQGIVQEGQARVAAKRQAAASGASKAAGKGKGAPSPGGKQDNSDRKAFLKGEIIEWKAKFKKAEASYQQALGSGGDNWEKQRVIDSKRRTVDECLEMIRQYESELNSL